MIAFSNHNISVESILNSLAFIVFNTIGDDSMRSPENAKMV